MDHLSQMFGLLVSKRKSFRLLSVREDPSQRSGGEGVRKAFVFGGCGWWFWPNNADDSEGHGVGGFVVFS